GDGALRGVELRAAGPGEPPQSRVLAAPALHRARPGGALLRAAIPHMERARLVGLPDAARAWRVAGGGTRGAVRERCRAGTGLVGAACTRGAAAPPADRGAAAPDGGLGGGRAGTAGFRGRSTYTAGLAAPRPAGCGAGVGRLRSGGRADFARAGEYPI